MSLNDTSFETDHAARKAACLASSRKCVSRINDYWAARGVRAGAMLGAHGEVVSSIDVTRHHSTPTDAAPARSAA